MSIPFLTLPLVSLLADQPTLNDVAASNDQGFFRTVMQCGDTEGCVDGSTYDLTSRLELSELEVAAVIEACDGALAKVKDHKAITLGNLIGKTKGAWCAAARDYDARGARILGATYTQYLQRACADRAGVGASLGTPAELASPFTPERVARLTDETGAAWSEDWTTRFAFLGAGLPPADPCLRESATAFATAWGAARVTAPLASPAIRSRVEEVARDTGLTTPVLAVHVEPWEIKTYSDGSIDDRRARLLVLTRVDGEPHCRAHTGTLIQEYIGSRYVEGGEAAIVDRERFLLRACP